MIEFKKVHELLNLDSSDVKNPFYCDTDSLFLTLPFSLEKETDKAFKFIDHIQTTINEKSLAEFLKLHNIKIRETEENPLLRCDFKNEFLIKSMILYSKKRYISIIINKNDNGDIFYDIDIKGVDGKRTTNKFVKILVDDLISYLKNIESDDNIYKREDILNKIILRYRNDIFNYKNKSIYENINYFAMPVNVNKHISELKTVSGYYKGTLNFDIVGIPTWEYKRGKGKWLRVKLKDESYIPVLIKELEKYPQIKIQNKKPEELISDITIPDEYLQQENATVEKIFGIFEIDYDKYFDQLLQKIDLLYRPFDEMFCENLVIKNNKTLPLNFIIFGQDNIYTSTVTQGFPEFIF